MFAVFTENKQLGTTVIFGNTIFDDEETAYTIAKTINEKSPVFIEAWIKDWPGLGVTEVAEPTFNVVDNETTCGIMAE